MRLLAFLLVLYSIFLDVFFYFFRLFRILLLNLFRGFFSHLGLVFGGAPGARSTTSTALSCVGRGSNRNTCHQTGNAKPCYEAFNLILVHVLTTFPCVI